MFSTSFDGLKWYQVANQATMVQPWYLVVAQYGIWIWARREKKVVQNGEKKEDGKRLCGMWTTQRIAMTNIPNTKKQYVDIFLWTKQKHIVCGFFTVVFHYSYTICCGRPFSRFPRLQIETQLIIKCWLHTSFHCCYIRAMIAHFVYSARTQIELFNVLFTTTK